MFNKKIFQIFFLVIIFFVTVSIVYVSNLARQGAKIYPSKAEETAQPEYKPGNNQLDPNQWPEYVHPDLNYSFRYPQEFKLEKRGKVGNIEDLLAINYLSDGKQLTVAKFQLTNDVPEGATTVSQKGKDNNGNEVLIYKIPFKGTKTLTLIGTIYPNIGSNFRFEEVIQKISQTIKVL